MNNEQDTKGIPSIIPIPFQYQMKQLKHAQSLTNYNALIS